MIQPTIRFGQLQQERSTAFKLAAGIDVEEAKPYYMRSGFNATFCNTTITPTCLRQLYNVGNFKADPRNGILLGNSKTPSCLMLMYVFQATCSVLPASSSNMPNIRILRSS